MKSVADHIAAGEVDAAMRAGEFLDRRSYGEACRRGEQMRCEAIAGNIVHFVARCLAKLRAVAARFTTRGIPR